MSKRKIATSIGATNIKLYAIKENAKTKDHTNSYRKNEKLNIPPEHIISLIKIIYCLAKNNIPLNKFKPLAYLGHAIEASHLVSEDYLIIYENNSSIEIIVDESTDISTESHIIIYVKYLINTAEEKPIIIEDRILADVEMKEGAGYKEALQNSLIVKEANTHSVASVSPNPKAKLVNEKLHESSGKLKEENSSTEDSPQDSYCEIKPK
ncbi:11879_t:CDS:2, partial [Dentiscutata heterogama]